MNDIKQELLRKIFHICGILILPVIYAFLSKSQMLCIVAPLAIIIIATDFYRHKFSIINDIFNAAFSRILRAQELEQNSWTGASFMAASALITFGFFPKTIAICAFTILAVSDCLAALVGKTITSKEFFEKSLAGSIAFGVSAFVVLVICGLANDQKLYYYFFGTLAVFATTIIEARPSFLKLDDNLTIPLSFSCIMMLFAVIWGVGY